MASFNPQRSVLFDLGQGAVRLTAGEPQVLVSASVIAALADAHPDPRPLGRALGGEIAERAILRVRRGPPPPGSPEGLRAYDLREVVELVGGEMALVGLGNLRVERWGAALVFALEPCALDARADRLLEGVIEGAVAGAGGRIVHAAIIDRDEKWARFLVANDAVAARAAEMHRAGTAFPEILATIQSDAREPRHDDAASKEPEGSG
jgi:hypothetical protein